MSDNDEIAGWPVFLTVREHDLMTRLLRHILAECDSAITSRVEKVAVTWLRDEVKALLPRFERPADAP